MPSTSGARDPQETSAGSDAPRWIGAASLRIFSTDEPFVAQDPWKSLNHDAKAIPAEEASLTIRAFGLDGRVEFELDDATLVWGGSLIDLADCLADWDPTKPGRTDFEPLEQASNLRFDSDGTTVVFSTMGQRIGHLSATDSATMVDRFLTDLVREIAMKAPTVIDLPGMSWMASRR